MQAGVGVAVGVKQEGGGGGGGGGGLGDSRDTAMLQSMHYLHNIAAATASYPLSLAAMHSRQQEMERQAGGDKQHHLAAAGNYRPL